MRARLRAGISAHRHPHQTNAGITVMCACQVWKHRLGRRDAHQLDGIFHCTPRHQWHDGAQICRIINIVHQWPEGTVRANELFGRHKTGIHGFTKSLALEVPCTS
jgi:hypothetical protein